MSGQIDVLAVMEQAALDLGTATPSSYGDGDELSKAAAAVAELMALARKVEVAANTTAYCYERMQRNFAVALSELGKDVAQLRECLARIGGAA